MSKSRRNHSAGVKAKVALEALKGEATVAELAAKHGVHQTLINEWKRQLVEGTTAVFERGTSRPEKDNEALTGELYKQIGQLKVENGLLGNAVGGIFCLAGWRAESGDEASHGRERQHGPQRCATMPASRDQSIIAVLPANQRSQCRGLDVDGSDRQTVPG